MRAGLKPALLAFFALAASLAAAQDYPAREIRSLCNFGAGSGADIVVRFYSDRLSIGHETQAGLFSEHNEVTSAIYSANWLANPRISFNLAVGLEHVVESSGFSLQSSYNRFVFTMQTGYQFTKRISASLIYQFTDKIASPSDQSYRQNRIGVSVNYRF